MTATQRDDVIRYYDTHPINEDEILAKLAARGANLAALTQDELKDFDQDHYGGVDVVDALAARAGIVREHHVLDVCSGMGGPARWLAHRIGCRVTGLDFTRSRVDAARRLTQRVGLDSLVDFVHGDATKMPLPDCSYDRVISQEAWLHIPDKAALIAQCARVVKPNGVLAFTDVVLRVALTNAEESRMASEMQAPGIAPVSNYLELLARSGFSVESNEDLSTFWTDVLVKRLEMYRGLRDTTIAKFGEARFQEWDSMYSFLSDCFVTGKLGGARIVARKRIY